MKMKELRELTPEELASQLREAREALFTLRLQALTGQLEDHRRIRQRKRGIARILTLQNARKRAGEGLESGQ